MTKRLDLKRVIPAAVLSAAMCVSGVLGVTGLLANADEAEPAAEAQTRDYNKYLDRYINDLATDDRVEIPYRHVEWRGGVLPDDPGDCIYKVSSQKLNTYGVSKIYVTLRSPDNSVKLDDLYVGFANVIGDVGNAGLYSLTAKTQSDLEEMQLDGEIAERVSLSGEATDISDEWVTITIDVLYHNDVKPIMIWSEDYPFGSADSASPDATADRVGFIEGGQLVSGTVYNSFTSFHILSQSDSGTLDIASIEFDSNYIDSQDPTKEGYKENERVTLVKFDIINNAATTDDAKYNTPLKDAYGLWWNGTYSRYTSDDEKCIYWNVPAQLVFKDALEVKAANQEASNFDGRYQAIVLGIKGGGDFTVAPIDGAGTVGAAKKLSQLTDLAGVTPVSDEENFKNIVISLQSLGCSNIAGVVVTPAAGTSAILQGVFLTNMDDGRTDLNFPKLDTESIVFGTQFGFEYANIGADYNASVTALKGEDVTYVLSYNNPQTQSVIANGHLVLNSEGADYTQVKVRTKTASEGKRYMVLRYRLEDGATLNDFRFSVIDAVEDNVSAIVYANKLFSGYWHYSLAEGNPYEAGGDYEYLIVDTVYTFDKDNVAGADFYFSGPGKLMIDEIFYVDEAAAPDRVYIENTFDDFSEVPSTTGTHGWTSATPSTTYWGMSLAEGEDGTANGAVKVSVVKAGTNTVTLRKLAFYNDKQYVSITLKLEGISINTFKFGLNASRFTIPDKKAALVSIDGAPVDVIPDDGEWHTYVFDLDVLYPSGRNLTYLTFQENAAWAVGSAFYVDDITYFDDTCYVFTEEQAIRTGDAYTASKTIPTDASTTESYNYLCGGDFANRTGAELMKLEIVSVGADGNPYAFKWTNFRFELVTSEGSTEVWSTGDNKQFNMVDGGQTLLFELANLVSDPSTITAVHFHMGMLGRTALGSTVTFKVTYLGLTPTYETVQTGLTQTTWNDDAAPVIGNDRIFVDLNSEVDLTEIEVYDYMDEAEDITVRYSVTYNGEDVTVTGNKFNATQSGDYTVAVTATDSKGNSKSYSYTVTVHTHTYETEWSKDETKHWHEATCGHDVKSGEGAHDTNGEDGACSVCGYKAPAKGLSGGAIAGIAVGSVAGVGAIGAAVWFIIKKRRA